MSTQAEKLVEYNKILLDVQDYFQHVLSKEENISKGAKEKYIELSKRLNELLKPPERPPRTSTIQRPSNLDELQHKTNEDNPSTSTKKHADHSKSENNGNDQKRRMSQFFVETPASPTDDFDNIYEEISVHQQKKDSITATDGQNGSDEPPPVPERKGRSSSAIYDKTIPLASPTTPGDGEPVMVHDLKNPLYSGLLRNVKLDIKQWCVVKRQKLYLFNDLEKPFDFVADLSKYSVFKDSHEKWTFHVKEDGQKSIVLAAVDDEQYELWYNAFRRAKILAETKYGHINSEGELAEYVSLRGSDELEDDEGITEDDDDDGIDFVDENEDASYETPDAVLEKLSSRLSPTIYEEMTNRISSPDSLPLSPHNYEDMAHNQIYNEDDYSKYLDMPLPPTPDDEKPALPERTRRTRQMEKSDGTSSFSEGEEASISGSFTSLIDENEHNSEIMAKTKTWPRVKKEDSTKGKKEREIEFLRDLSAVYCGVLHQRRMLAVWQKRFCQVKDQCLLCYRQPDTSTEPSLKLKLTGYQLDRAEETWKSFSFKIFKEDTDALYFAAENLNEQMKWLSVLAKEANQERFRPSDISESASPIMEEEDNSTEESSTENIPDVLVKRYSSTSKASTSDFDGDSEKSAESEEIEQTSQQQPKLTPRQHLLPHKNNRKKRAQSFDDPEADMQGFLYRKVKNHWSRRWCSIKDSKFNSYKRTPNQPPDLSVLLVYASLILQPEGESNEGYYVFKLRYEGEHSTIFSTKQMETWKFWTDCLSKYVGSTSEESFVYINVPPSSNQNNDDKNERHNTQSFKFAPDLISSPLDTTGRRLTSSYHVPLPPRAPSSSMNFDFAPRSDDELQESRHSGILTELQLHQHTYKHVERFVILTKEKHLKFYVDVTANVPVAIFNALALQVIDEKGVDPLILRLHIDETGKELLLKTANEKETLGWKKAFERIHYEEIDDVITDEEDDDEEDEDDITNKVLSGDELPTEKVYRNRSKTIDKKNKSEPVLISRKPLYRTMPNVGKLKKRSKENRDAREKDKEKAKTSEKTHSSPQDTPTRERKGISSLIRSFTVDTLTRKAKNKSYELPVPREDDILIKETQNGVLKQVEIVNEEIIEHERSCRISGKVFYCYASEKDTKPLFKVPLRNAVIEESVDIPSETYKFIITAMDTGDEYTFVLNSIDELDKWVAALYGNDQLHKSLDSSQYISTTTMTSSTETTKSPQLQMKHPASPTASESLSIISKCSSHDEHFDTIDNRSTRSMTADSITSINSISSSKTNLNKTKSKEKVNLSGMFFEVIKEGELSKTSSKRWVELRVTVIEIYTRKKEELVKSLPLDSSFLVETDENTTKKIIQLRSDGGSTTQLIAPTDELLKTWVNEIRRLQKDLRRSSKERSRLSVSYLGWRKNSTERSKSTSRENRNSMMLVADDVKAVRDFENEVDSTNSISGILIEYFEDSKEKKERVCWIKDGFFYLAKKSKSEKAIKSIDLSTVVILDESEPEINKFAFQLDYSSSVEKRHIYLRALDQSIADRWMVAISMGILFHRLSGPTSRDTYIDEEKQKDFEFVQLSEVDFEESRDRSSSQYELGEEIKQELLKKAQDDGELVNVSQLLKNEFPSPKISPVIIRKTSTVVGRTEEKEFKQPVLPKSDSFDLTKPRLENSDSTDFSPPPELPPKPKENKTRRISQLNPEEDHVFAIPIDDNNLDLLENIPERENAEETFKNVKGILRQQESIRRGILHRQRSNASQKTISRASSNVSQNSSTLQSNNTAEKSRKTPPKLKPKPKLRKAASLSTSSYVVVDRHTIFKTDLKDCSTTQLRNYKIELESERSSLVKCIKNLTNILSESKEMKSDGSMSSTVSESEYQTALDDQDEMHSRLLLVDKELKNVHSSINRKVAVSLGQTKKIALTKTSSAGRNSLHNSPMMQKRIHHTHEEGYSSEPLLDSGNELEDETSSIII